MPSKLEQNCLLKVALADFILMSNTNNNTNNTTKKFGFDSTVIDHFMSSSVEKILSKLKGDLEEGSVYVSTLYTFNDDYYSFKMAYAKAIGVSEGAVLRIIGEANFEKLCDKIFWKIISIVIKKMLEIPGVELTKNDPCRTQYKNCQLLAFTKKAENYQKIYVDAGNFIDNWDF